MRQKQDLTTQEVIERLAAHYPSPQYGFITQVRNGTGANAGRTADAMAMSLWPSRGLSLFGFVVKVSRPDWMKELKDPGKAEEMARYCHYWYMVLGNEEIIKEGELPATWGLIVPHSKGLRVVKEAPFNQKAHKIDDILMAAIFRNIAERCIPKEVIQRKLDEQYTLGKESVKYDVEEAEQDLRELKQNVKTFETASGVKITDWPDSNKEIGQAVNDVINGRDKQAKKRLGQLLTRARNIVKYIEGEDISKYDL